MFHQVKYEKPVRGFARIVGTSAGATTQISETNHRAEMVSAFRLRVAQVGGEKTFHSLCAARGIDHSTVSPVPDEFVPDFRHWPPLGLDDYGHPIDSIN